VDGVRGDRANVQNHKRLAVVKRSSLTIDNQRGVRRESLGGWFLYVKEQCSLKRKEGGVPSPGEGVWKRDRVNLLWGRGVKKLLGLLWCVKE